MTMEITIVEKVQVGEIIRLLRQAEGQGPTSLAEELGITREELLDFEKGVKEPGKRLLRKIAKYFQIPLAVLRPEIHKEDAGAFEDLNRLLVKVLEIKKLARKA